MSKIIIQDMIVVDVVYLRPEDSQNASAVPGQANVMAEKPRNRLGAGSTVTFEVKPEDAEKFTLIEAAGYGFHLILRNHQDDSTVNTSGYTTTDLIRDAFNGFGQAEAPAPAATKAAPPKASGRRL